MNVHIKRVYDEPAPDDGERILIDRLWPRGLTKERADIALWLKDIAPSTALRKWFNHDPDKWDEFKKRYRDELDANTVVTARLIHELSSKKAMLVYSAHDEVHNDAVVLKGYLEGK